MSAPVEAPPARYLTVKEIAADLRVHKMTVYRMIASGQLASVKVGRSYRVPVASFQALLRAEASL